MTQIFFFSKTLKIHDLHFLKAIVTCIQHPENIYLQDKKGAAELSINITNFFFQFLKFLDATSFWDNLSTVDLIGTASRMMQGAKFKAFIT